MMEKKTCKDCIHFKICNDYVYLIGREDKVACPYFKATEDVVPRSEVDKAKREVAREIFGELEEMSEICEYREVVTWESIAELEKKYIGE